MANLILPRRFTQQPQYPSEINLNNPLSRGLICCLLPQGGALVNVGNGTTKKVFSPNPNSVLAGSYNGGSMIGPELTTRYPFSSAGLQSEIDAIINASGEASMFGALRINAGVTDAGGNTNGPLWKGQGSGDAEHYPFIDGNMYMGTLSYAGTRWISGVTPWTSLYSPHIYGATFKTGRQRAFLNNRIIASASNADTPRFSTVNNPDGPWLGAATTWFGFWAWDRVLLDDEAFEFIRNPWQIFRRSPQVLYFDTAGGGATSVECSSGSVVVSGQSATISETTAVPCTAASVIVTGQSATVVDYTKTLVECSAATVPVTGQSATVVARTHIAATAATVPVTGQQATVIAQTNIAATAATVAVTGGIGSILELVGRYARPDEDISDGAWLPSTPAADLFAMVDEDVVDDADYAYTASASTMELGLPPAADPGTSSGQVVYYRARSAYGNTLTVTLKEGATTIASAVQPAVPTDWTTFEMVLTPAECDAITDYRNLSVAFEAAA